MRKYHKSLFLIFVFMQYVTTIAAQDTHYNTYQFGARSALLGGAVIGSVRDNTAVFYNPGALGFIDTGALSINANAYQIDNIRIYNALGQRKDFKSSQFGSIPLLIGGMLTSGKNKLKIGYAMMSPVNFNFKANARIDDKIAIVDDTESPGKEEFIGAANINYKLNEFSAGLGGGIKLNENWSIGLTNMLIVRSLLFERSNYSRFFLNTAGIPMVSSSFVRNVDYNHVRYVAKIGVNYQYKKFSAGLIISTPSLSLFGKGTIAVDFIGNNILYEGSRTSLLANDRQEGLKTFYKSPLNVSAGLNWSLKRSFLGIAAQYYGSIKLYDIIRANPAVLVRPASLNSSIASDGFLRVKTAAKPVVNISVGYEFMLNQSVTLYTSFRTNQSYFDEQTRKSPGIKTDYTTWDIYHFTAGTTIIHNRSKISIGILYNFGKDDSWEQNDDLTQPKESDFLQGTTSITKATYRSIGFLLGYTFVFKKN